MLTDAQMQERAKILDLLAKKLKTRPAEVGFMLGENIEAPDDVTIPDFRKSLKQIHVPSIVGSTSDPKS